MNREEILKEIDEAMSMLKETRRKVNGAFSHARNIVVRNGDDVAGYNKGLEDAWKLGRKISHYTKEGLLDRFGTTDIMCVFDEYTAQEALAKLEAYEKAQEEIKVGDVVEGKEANVMGVVVKKSSKDKAYILFRDGSAGIQKIEDFKKTGEHIDIISILGQIGGVK